MIYDISPPICERLKVWPGDTPPSREVLMEISRGDSVTLSTLRSTVHLGAHADAPSHYGAGAATIEQQPLELYIGPCQVLSVRAAPLSRIGPDAIEEAIEAERVLFRTDTFLDPCTFNEDFAGLSADLVHHLAESNVRLVGIDTPSVDLFTSKGLPTHQACLERRMAILEGLVLKDVPDGLYELLACPLPLVGFDASPVRAVLRS